MGLPDETRVRKACNQSRQVVVLAYGGHATDIWWNKIAGALARHDNLSVLAIGHADTQQLAALCERGMRLQCLIQDRELQLIAGERTLAIRPDVRLGDYAVA